MTAPLVNVRDLKIHFQIGGGLFRRPDTLRAVDGVSFTINRGETLGLVGESGCGKSTLARTLIRLYQPTAGAIDFDGTDIAALPEADLRPLRKRIQMIFQDPLASLDGRMSVRQLISEPLDILNIGTPAERRATVAALLTRVGLSPAHADRYPHEFSGGQRQRIGIARVIALNPDLVICDEPISALDVSIQAQVVNMLQDLQRDLGLTYLFITHDLSMVRHIADRIGVMYLGKIVELAPAGALYARPRHPYTRLLLSAVPVADPAARRDVTLVTDEVPSPINLPTGCRFRTRCPLASSICAQVEPALQDFGDGHLVACHHGDAAPDNNDNTNTEILNA
ncbi:oligopeptide/dipeptide ABC transporter, ATP-binding protein (plasmid) [Ketogulonicigenium robustum]|uniref:Oligopeptide/dipeptide ABC transporter, ATP-binding protein n=1 Tax=Ketogulonicigenium robustum TaxID=92947 RepID=A0A1W6P3B1_9RHOB|nr:dipeptide ABC transporter ATP-binding protein [Ketogulonicigenium robustum]ARO15881.1 oligopeptide/dipeptide ABC transporter, ATP-binding protein [Ketogulonicigenium robustum]